MHSCCAVEMVLCSEATKVDILTLQMGDNSCLHQRCLFYHAQSVHLEILTLYCSVLLAIIDELITFLSTCRVILNMHAAQ